MIGRLGRSTRGDAREPFIAVFIPRPPQADLQFGVRVAFLHLLDAAIWNRIFEPNVTDKTQTVPSLHPFIRSLTERLSMRGDVGA
jgi:hypothetical protein